MSTVTLIEPDPFLGVGAEVVSYIPDYRNDSADVLAAKATKAASLGFDTEEIQSVSRPLNGIAVKPNTHAYVQVIKSNQEVVRVFNQLGLPALYAQSGSSYDTDSLRAIKGIVPPTGAAKLIPKPPPPEFGDGFKGTLQNGVGQMRGGSATDPNGKGGVNADGTPNARAWTDWILQGVREARIEKTQVVETFGDSYLYAFGEKPRVLAFTGLLMNTADYNWRAIFWENWDKYFRASKLIQLDARLYIGWEDIIVEGYPLSATCQEQAQSPNAMNFSFNLYVTNYFNMSMANKATVASRQKQYSLSMSQSRPFGTPVNDTEWSDGRQMTSWDKLLGKGMTDSPILWGDMKHGISTDGYILDADGNKTKKAKGIDLWLMKSAKQAADAAAKFASGYHTQSTSQVMSFLNANLLQFTKNSLQAASEPLRGTTGTWGEVNAWYGYAQTLGTNLLDTFGGRWDGTRTDWSGVGAALGTAFLGGWDALINQMAYQGIGMLGLTGGDRHRASTLKVGENNEKSGFEAHPYGSGVTNVTPVEYGGDGVDAGALVDIASGVDTAANAGAGSADAADPLRDPFGIGAP